MILTAILIPNCRQLIDFLTFEIISYPSGWIKIAHKRRKTLFRSKK